MKNKQNLFYIVLLFIVLVFVIYIQSYILDQNEIVIETFFEKSNNKLCVIYNYYEKNQLYIDNFQYFLEKGILDELDYYIIINGNSTVDIPKKENIVVYNRENIGYDFGAYSYIVNNKLKKKYDYYFFMNTSVKGPYLKNKDKKWYEYFISLFNKNIHLVGTSINICTDTNVCIHKNYKKKVNPHVQSMFFVMDDLYFSELVKDDFFNEEEINQMNMNTLIEQKEVGMSEKAIEKGYNINCILSKYKDLDYLHIQKDINTTSYGGDPYFNNGYFGETIDPYEVIFFKNNRNIL